ncbi:MAG: N-acetylmuramoyl-L-alanine amidase [Myxococcota bacterium]
MNLRRTIAFSLTAFLLAGCAATDEFDLADGEGAPSDDGLVPPGELSPEDADLETIFSAAASDFDVPVALLKAVAWAESGWQMATGAVEFEGQLISYGIMGLRGDQVEEGARLAGFEVDEVRYELEPNIRAGAAVLSAYGDDFETKREELGSWAEVAAAYSLIESEQGQAHYVHAEVYDAIQYGQATEVLQIEARPDVIPSFIAFNQVDNGGPDYAPAKWRPSPNNSARPSGSKGNPQMVIIHTCEGSYSGCWNWLRNSQSGVSAHYVVNSTGSEITQLVRENRKAWHIGASYKCSRNSGTKCSLENTSSNNFTIGIEHAGKASQSSWNTGLIDASADLVCDITKDQNIPIDSFHIVGHGQLQPYNRVDPGPNWPWATYLSKIDAACNGGGGGNPGPGPGPDPDPGPGPDPQPGGFDVVVDSNPGANGSGAEILVGGSWNSSNNVAGFYNTGYWWRSTGSSSDLARFRVFLNAPKKIEVMAWWPSAGDRSPNAPWIIFDGDGSQLDVVKVNQQQNGGKWVSLGTYNMSAGWAEAALSRWTTSGYVVVADAVRFREVP